MRDTGMDSLKEWETINKKEYQNVKSELTRVRNLFTAMEETWELGNTIKLKAPPFNLETSEQYDKLCCHFQHVYRLIASARIDIELKIQAREATLSPVVREWKAINEKAYYNIQEDIARTEQLFQENKLPWLSPGDMKSPPYMFNTTKEHEDLNQALLNVAFSLNLRKQWLDDRIILAPLEEMVVQNYEQLYEKYKTIQKKYKDLGLHFEIKKLTPPPYLLCTEKMYCKKLDYFKQLYTQLDLGEVTIRELRAKLDKEALKNRLIELFQNEDVVVMILDLV